MAKRKSHKRLGAITRGLLIQSPHIEKVLSDQKTWEIRGYAAKIRGPIALIRSGSGQIVGTCKIVDVRGPLTRAEFLRNARKIGLRPSEIGRSLPYARTYAWVLKDARRLRTPLPYKHPSGAIGWVRFRSHPRWVASIESSRGSVAVERVLDARCFVRPSTASMSGFAQGIENTISIACWR